MLRTDAEKCVTTDLAGNGALAFVSRAMFSALATFMISPPSLVPNGGVPR